MEPNNSSINDNPPATTPNFQQPTNPMPGTAQSSPVMPMNETPQQSPAVSQPYTMNRPMEQSTPPIPHQKGSQKHNGLIIGSIIIAAIYVLISTEMSVEKEFAGAPIGTTMMFSLLTLPTFFFEVGIVASILYAVGILFRKTILKNNYIPNKIARAISTMLIVIFLGILFYYLTRY